MDNNGVLNFDVNDFDESYIGPFTWDVKRLSASLYLIAYSKGFSDRDIQHILTVCVEEYLKKVYDFCRGDKENFALTLRNTTGKIQKLLNEARLKSHTEHLNDITYIENYDRKFIRSENIQSVNNDLHDQLTRAFKKYLESIPENKKYRDRSGKVAELTYRIKDIVQRTSPGIGSAGKISYSFLIEGRNETLDSDVILYMKPAQKSAVSHVVQNQYIEQYFQSDGLRTVLCSYAMQASTPKWLGYTTLNSVSCMVDAVAAHSEDLEWSDINTFEDMTEVVQYLGQATGKISSLTAILKQSSCVYYISSKNSLCS